MSKVIKNIVFILFVTGVFVACEKPDSEKEWGEALVYMPQANYLPYEVPNKGSDVKRNLNYSIDESNGKVNVFLGVYRSGLQELESYEVSVRADTANISGAVALPVSKFQVPEIVTCPAGQRDVSFYLSINLDFLRNNQADNYSVAVEISNPSKYELNEELVRTSILIKTKALFAE